MKTVPCRAAVIFLVWGITWILAGESVLQWIAHKTGLTASTIENLENGKGIFFVIVSAIVLYIAILRGTRKYNRAQEEYHNLFRYNPVPMFIYNPKNGRILAANETCCIQYGYTHVEMRGLSIDAIRLQHDVLQNNESTRLADVGIQLHRKHSGQEFWIHKFAREIPFKGLQARLVLAIDVNEEMSAKDRLVRQNARLAEIAWFESHELRAPIARILGLLQLYDRGNPARRENAEIIDYLAATGTELEHVVRLLTQKTISDDHQDSSVA